VTEYLQARAGVVGMVVGHNVSFGRNRAGNATVLTEIGARRGFSVDVVGPVEQGGTHVSSTAVRDALARGDVAAAAALLGRPHCVSGRVGWGEQRGRQLGFPTANLVSDVGLLPKDGVYAVRTRVRGTEFPGVANVGTRPTFGATGRGIEVHLFGFQGDLYRQRLRVDFVERLRAERRFANVDALVQQIRRDVEAAQSVLAGVTSRRRAGSEG
jgi:riboflavin kinase/FMN adenylyltransferase